MEAHTKCKEYVKPLARQRELFFKMLAKATEAV
jgi:hypothetical protein